MTDPARNYSFVWASGAATNRDTTAHELVHQWDDVALQFEDDGHDNHRAHDDSDLCLMNVNRKKDDDTYELCVYHLYMIRDGTDSV